MNGAGASCSYTCASRLSSPVCIRSSRRNSVRVYAVNYDPEQLFKRPPETGLISRRMTHKMMEQNKDFASQMQRAKDDIRRQVLTRREARNPPEDPMELVEYMLNTEAEDMEFEVARCRPKLTPAFFKQLDSVIGAERFAAKPDQERLAELETLRQYLEEAVEAVDKAVVKTASAAERLKKLLTAKDKKETILEMVAANEIDQALVDLLQQNIDAAKAAEQTAPAEFMEKVKMAVSKYLVTV
ncbi:hypothetical protein VOLCADRAFT_80381 [Volvox carteri f. nagariensis]|uniref:Uncharacterized protein n=1 Tax=Volvox carteri f. nagariensis TaxID=3068 RepID=D8TQZ6_VOLCA|nr:uncharacterized protein VOLCADRAFT_80381 [Volvox carteri f. nagariensis]EFJ50247.1 hypothetical protein VOLCADRAFT_80381 [Volvox carteri f. nagariensis]|eukprot:XP_002948867.1 hypothetical protein VOLCADRAFT_80381 [Volvox carteri f. nagariensis]